MELLDDFLALIDYIIDTDKRKHIIGGVLLSVSILFMCLAFTIFTIKTERMNDNE